MKCPIISCHAYFGIQLTVLMFDWGFFLLEMIEQNAQNVMSILNVEYSVAVVLTQMSRSTLMKIKGVWESEVGSIPDFETDSFSKKTRIEYLAHRLEVLV
jgi:hypothetical protein